MMNIMGRSDARLMLRNGESITVKVTMEESVELERLELNPCPGSTDYEVICVDEVTVERDGKDVVLPKVEVPSWILDLLQPEFEENFEAIDDREYDEDKEYDD